MNLTKVKLLALLALSVMPQLMGCVHEDVEYSITETCHEYTVYIDESFRPQRQSIIEESAQRWADLTTTLQLKFEVVPIEQIEEVQYSYGTIVVVNEEQQPGYFGWTAWDSDWAYVTIPDDYGKKFFRATAIHEFGHAFHLWDTPEQVNSVMSFGDDITCYDLNQFCARWECRTPILCDPS